MTRHVLQATAWYPPHSVGGTEVYVEDLAAALAARGIGSAIVTPRPVGVPSQYEHAGQRVETYCVDASHARLDDFRRILAGYRGSIYHQHSWTPDCGPDHLMTARALGLRTVLSVHVAAVTCLRGTMLRFGSAPCSGRVEAVACGACWAQGRGLPRPMAQAVSHLPLAAARRLRTRPSRLATALSARAIGSERREQLRRMIAGADRIVAVCRWLADALIENGVPPGRLTLSRHGLQPAFLAAAGARTARLDADALAILYLGRWDPIKGIDVLVRAVRMSSADCRLTIRAVAQTDADRAFAADVRRLAADDPRIVFAAPVARDDVAAELGRHDVLAVPSQGMETGPLVVLEAQAAGLFVLGSRLGGIAELVADGDAGRLVEPGNASAWAKAIEILVAGSVRRGRPAAVRSMTDVAADMADLYGSL